MSGKREEYIDWDTYFLGLAALASFRSKDPSTQNGCVIVDPSTLHPLVSGYNGFPRGCSDDEFPWDRTADNIGDTKYPYVEHSERNAIFLAAGRGISLSGSVLYLYSEKGYYPCNECARAIIQSGIREVKMAWAMDGNTDVYDWNITKRMFDKAGVIVNVLTLDSSDVYVEEVVKNFRLISSKMMGIAELIETKRSR